MIVPVATRYGSQPGLRAAFRSRPIFNSVPAAVPIILLGILLLATVPLVYLLNVPKPQPRAEATRVEIERTIQSEGFDKQGRRLPFTVYVLSAQRSWKLESASDLEDDRPLVSPELVAALHQARDVFCIGTASFEGRRNVEEARAALRAETLAGWLTGAMPQPHKIRVYRLNAGQYVGPQKLESTDQRKAIIIITQGHDEDVSLRDALKSGLSKKQRDNPIVYSLLHHYSRSDKWLKLSR